MSHDKKSLQHGFTIVELTLSMAFIAMLLLAVALLTSQIGSVYNKGLTLKAVNDAGTFISRDIQQTLNESASSRTRYVNGSDGGRLCANNAVYAWNYGNYISGSSYGLGGRNKIGPTSTKDVRLVRFTGGEFYCTSVAGAYPFIPNDSSARLVHLLDTGDVDLVLHDLSFSSSEVEGDDMQKIYSVSFILGTKDMPSIGATGCRVPTSKVDDVYCAVNQFDFTARAGRQE